MRAWVLAALLCAAIGGCKKRPSYDRQTPETTLRSFFEALDKGRIPADLERFIGDPREAQLWNLRCRERGCKGGTFTIVEIAEASTYRATLVVDYRVIGDHGAVIMRGERSPISFVREDDHWQIVQFGRRITAKARDAGATATPPAPSGDAGAARAPDDPGSGAETPASAADDDQPGSGGAPR